MTGTFIGDGTGITGIVHTTAETASYVAGGDVDGAVANATLAASASDIGYNDVRDKPTLVSESAQLTGQIDVTGVSASFTGTFVGGGAGLTGIVSVSHAVDADAAVLAVSAVTSLTASFVAGTNVDGAVSLADTSSYVAGANVDGAVDTLVGQANLTSNSDMSASQFTHERLPVSAALADFTISFNDGQTQAYAISASVQFEIADMEIGGFYIVEFENQANHILTLPSAAPLVFHEGTPVTSSAATGALDVYGFYHRGANTLMTIMGEDIG